MRFWALSVTLWVSACAVSIEQGPMLKCEEARPCGGDRVCVDEHCLDPSMLTACDEPVFRAAPNMIPNHSFEGSTVGWAGYLGSTIEVVDGGFVGEQALQITGPSDLENYGLNDNIPTVRHGLAKEHCYSAWVRSPTGEGGTVGFQIKEYDQSEVLQMQHQSHTVELKGHWQRVVFSLTPRTNDAILDYHFLNWAPKKPNEVFLIDGLSIRQRP